jgi:hypothetical protein
MKKILSLYIFLFASIAYAQDDMVFKVLFNKGANTLDNGKAIVTGTKIMKGQSITLVEGGYIGMIYKTGKSLELKKSGVHSVSELEKGILSSSASFSKKYADLVLNEMTKSSDGLVDKRKKNMGVTGSVERGTETGLTLISPKNSEHLSSQVKLMWLKDSSAKSGYVVKVKDMFDEPLKSYEVNDTSVTINIGELNLKTSKSFIITVEVKNSKVTTTEGKLVKIIDGKKADELHKELKLIKEEAGDESALSKIILASFCEQNKMYLEAITLYEQAIALEPTVDEYKYAYNNFLERVELSHIKK